MKLYISEQQSIAAIINEVTRVPERAIELVFPENSTFFKEPENLQLLKNQGILLSKEISVISPDVSAIEASRLMGIPADLLSSKEASKVTEEIESSNEIEHDFLAAQGDSSRSADFTKRYFDLGKQQSTGVQPVELPSEETPIPINHREVQMAEEDPLSLFEKDIPAEEPHQSIDEELKEVVKKDSRALIIKGVAVIVGLGVVGFLYLYLPQATLQLSAQRERISFGFDVVAAKDATGVDIEKRSVPVQFIEITKELSQPFEVKKKGNLTTKAKGRITVYNELTTSQFMIPSRFQAASGEIYWSQRNINIPAKGSIEIEVVADKAGANYNLACTSSVPCTFTIPAWKGTDNYTKVYAKATHSLSGGSAGEGYIVSEAEFQQAQTALRTALLAEAQKEFSIKIPQEFTLLEDSIRSELVEISSTPAVDGISANGKAIVQGKIILQAFTINDKDIKTLVHTLVKNQLDKDKEAKEGSIKADYKILSLDYKTGKVSLNINASEEVAFVIDPEELKTRLAGKSETEVRNLLEDLPRVQSARITLWPFWVRTIPTRLERINIDIQ